MSECGNDFSDTLQERIQKKQKKMDENTVLPLINSTFEPGHALEKAESFKDKNFRDIALAELQQLEQPGNRRPPRNLTKYCQTLPDGYL